MIKRKTIGIYFFFRYDESASLAMYILNFIRILNKVPDEKKPQLVILYSSDAPIDDVKFIDYPYIEFYLYEVGKLKLGLIKRAWNKVGRILTGKNVFKTRGLIREFPSGIESIFPYFDLEHLPYQPRKIYWKADFQEYHYPENFPESDLVWSKNFMNTVATGTDDLVLSSLDSYKDFKQFFPVHSNKTKVMHFASLFAKPKANQISETKREFNIDYPYLIIANQFWPHKNHIVVLQALAVLKKQGVFPKIICTGKTGSYRDPEYFDKLKVFIHDNGLAEQLVFTGFIDRERQLALMSGALAVIQPSFFEGWSTVIEDAKALNLWVLASNINVNIEQIEENVFFFTPNDSLQLAGLIEMIWLKQPDPVYFNYQSCIDAYLRSALFVLDL